MNKVREAFEKISCTNFQSTFGTCITNKERDGTYSMPEIEDHWQTFQEGWEAAIDFLKQRGDTKYSDITSSDGMDPR